MKRIMAVASGGGHWQQLALLAPAFAGADVIYVTPRPYMAARSGLGPVFGVQDCSLRTPLRAARCGLQLLKLIVRQRPDVVVTTGALPGLLAVIAGRIFGARTIWIDSIANAEALSGSGRFARFVAEDWLTQWPGVATPNGPSYRGAVI